MSDTEQVRTQPVVTDLDKDKAYNLSMMSGYKQQIAIQVALAAARWEGHQSAIDEVVSCREQLRRARIDLEAVHKFYGDAMEFHTQSEKRKNSELLDYQQRVFDAEDRKELVGDNAYAAGIARAIGVLEEWKLEISKRTDGDWDWDSAMERGIEKQIETLQSLLTVPAEDTFEKGISAAAFYVQGYALAAKEAGDSSKEKHYLEMAKCIRQIRLEGT